MTNEEFKRTLWDTANKLRGSVSAAEYKYPVLGLVFLKYVSDMFDAQSAVIRHRVADPRSDLYIEDAETRKDSEDAFVSDKTFYDQDNVFWIPPDAHFSLLLAQATAPDIAQKLDRALGEIEAENPDAAPPQTHRSPNGRRACRPGWRRGRRGCRIARRPGPERRT